MKKVLSFVLCVAMIVTSLSMLTFSASAATAPAAPAMTGISNTTAGVQVTWKGVSNATSYRIYRKTAGKSWTAIANVGVNTRSYVDKSAKSGTTYQYTVRSLNKSTFGGFHKTGLSIRRLTTTKITSIANGPVNIVLKWNKVAGATGYYVYRKGVNSSWVRIATTKNPTYSDGNRSQGVQYFYTVRAYYGKNASACATTVNICRLQQPKLHEYINPNWTQDWYNHSVGTIEYYDVIINLNTNHPYVTGYQVYYKTDKGIARIMNAKKTGTSEGITNIAFSTTRSEEDKYGWPSTDFRVRTYRTVNGKTSYSCWSPVIKDSKLIAVGSK